MATDYAYEEKVRSELVARVGTMYTEYRAMLYGAAATPNETSAHFTRAKDGVIFSGTGGAALMYKSHE